MFYVSTRGACEKKTFEEVLQAAYAPDGGLYVPEKLPTLTVNNLQRMKDMNFPDICAEVLHIFSGIPLEDLKAMAHCSFSQFNDGDIMNCLPLTKLPHDFLKRTVYLLDTSLGPTLAFKDIGQQMVGQMLNYVLGKHRKTANVLIDTSGDTGPAAIAGVKGCPNVHIYCLYPHNRVSHVQELQMITAQEPNVHVYRTEGTNDDQSSILKELFGDEEFCHQNNICSVNSINWARIAAQSSYFVWSYLQLCKKEGLSVPHHHASITVDYVIPTGAFGNAMGGLLAKKMGVPIGKLFCATNANDIVHRTISSGDMSMGENVATYSPAMDIQFAYNLERMLYYMSNEDPIVVARIMKKMEAQYRFEEAAEGVQLDPMLVMKIQEVFESCSVKDDETLKTMRDIYEKYQTLLCPHSAIGVKAAMNGHGTLASREADSICCCVLTAHPAKFSDTVQRAIGAEPPVPAAVERLMDQPHRFTWLRKHLHDESSDHNAWRNVWIHRLKEDVIKYSTHSF